MDGDNINISHFLRGASITEKLIYKQGKLGFDETKKGQLKSISYPF
jgi:hypothetical protein